MIENFNEWWETLDGLLKTLYCIAFPSTMLLIIQTLLSLFGMHDGGMGHDFSDTSGLDLDISADVPDAGPHDLDIHHSIDGGDPGDFASMHLFTLQTVVTFLTVFSWSSIVLVGSDVPAAISLLIGAVLGVATMVMVAKIVQLSMRLTENGTVNLKNAIGETATVYVLCPPKNKGMGKVTITLQGQLMELGAFNSGDEMLATGTQVTVTDVRGDDVIVEKEQ